MQYALLNIHWKNNRALRGLPNSRLALQLVVQKVQKKKKMKNEEKILKIILNAM